jgi:membrane-associated phospholipid phosphatase
MPRPSRILRAAATALALAGCADHPTEPESALTPPVGGTSPADPSASTGSKVVSSVAWNGTARGLLTAQVANPFVQVRVLTYLSLAQYNAIITAENSKTQGPHPSAAGAAAGASVVVLKDFFPAQAQALEDQIAAQTGEKEDFTAGEAIGRVVGAEVVAYAHGDNTGVLPAPPVPVGPGFWTSTAPLLGLFGTRPLALTSADQFRPPPAPAFGSQAYLDAQAEIRLLSDTRTPEQLAQAQFWNTRVAGYQNEIASELIASRGRSERNAASILALANMAGFDALIACWDAKFTYWYIRPSQADPAITLPIGLPNHPSYPSAHSCVTAAYSEVLGHFFQDERPRLAANVEASGLSRMYGGIHYRFDIVAGRLLGRQVAEQVLATDVTGPEPIPLD